MTTAQLDRRGATLVTALLASLAVLLAPGSLPQLAFGGGGHARPLQGSVALEQARQAGIDIGGIIEAVDHHVAPVGGRPGLLGVEDRLYRAQFGPSGFALSLRAPVSRHARSSRSAKAYTFQARPALRIETKAISRGGRPLLLSPTKWRSERNAARRALAQGLTERVTAHEGWLEWHFVLSHPLPGTGALRLEAEVIAAGEPTRLLHGLRWPLANGQHVRIGELRVREAGGRELYHTRPQALGRRVVLDVPASVLARADYPLTIDPTVSPEYPVSEPVYGPAPNDQSSPQVAFDGTNYLVVWENGRGNGRRGRSDIYGTRISPAGTVLDPAGIAISTAPYSQGGPALAFDGTNYLVVWADSRASADSQVFGARVSPAGAVLDPDGIAIGNATGAPALAFDGTNYLVTWSTGYDVYGTRVSPAGTVLDTAGIAISTPAGSQSNPALAFDGTNYLVVWEDTRSNLLDTDVYGARVSPAGAVLDPAGIAISTDATSQYSPVLAFDGANYLVVWTDTRSGQFDYHVYGARVSTAGAVLDPGGLALSPASGQQAGRLALAFDGTNYLVAWRDDSNGDLYGTRVSPAGTVLDPAGIPISTAPHSQTSPALAFGGTGYLVVWVDLRINELGSSGYDIYGARVSPGGTVLDPDGVAISNEANSQSSPALAFDGTNYLVVCEDRRSSSDSDIYGARVSEAGALLDGGGIAISTATRSQESPAVAFDGTNYLVAWADRREGGYDPYDVYGARVSPAGTVLDPAAVAISTGPAVEWRPAVAFDGTNYLVAWQDARSGNYDIYGARVSPAGMVLDPGGIAISTAPYAQESPTLAFDGTNYLVAWVDTRTINVCQNCDIYGTRMSPAGTVLDPAGIPISTATNAQDAPALAFDGANYLAVWSDLRSGTSDIYGTRISPAGTVLDPAGIAISTAADGQYEPDVAFEGRDYFVAWSDYRSGTSYDVFGARVSTEGVVLDPAGLGLATSGSVYMEPALSRGPPGRIAVGYQRVTVERDFNPLSRVFLRFVDTRPANDDWADAENLGAGPGSWAGTTVDATGEPGEPAPDHHSVPLNSVWYRFTVPRATTVRLDTCGSSLDTILAIYTGSSVGALTEVAHKNNGCGHQSRIDFRAAAGVSYTVAVDGFRDATGSFTLHYSARSLPTHPRPGG